eukprot:m.105994 g.105994  ORF g.105994 m.105994 type:complete len:906 (-) comp13291_c0_seq4:613-3330(-)
MAHCGVWLVLTVLLYGCMGSSIPLQRSFVRHVRVGMVMDTKVHDGTSSWTMKFSLTTTNTSEGIDGDLHLYAVLDELECQLSPVRQYKHLQVQVVYGTGPNVVTQRHPFNHTRVVSGTCAHPTQGRQGTVQGFFRTVDGEFDGAIYLDTSSENGQDTFHLQAAHRFHNQSNPSSFSSSSSSSPKQAPPVSPQSQTRTQARTVGLGPAATYVAVHDSHVLLPQWSEEEQAYTSLLKRHALQLQPQHDSLDEAPYDRLQAGMTHRTSFGRVRRAVCKDTKCYCSVVLVADYKYFEHMGSDRDATVGAMVAALGRVDQIYRVTDFGGETGIGLSVARVVVYTSASKGPVSGISYSADTFLEQFSTSDWDDACLAHVFTHRDFGSILGLAWVGGQGAGICSSRYNVGMTTSLNFGSTVSSAVHTTTLAHEIGHNFGSNHDERADCTPGGASGNYIMFPSATDGSKPNNHKFSICSRDAIAQALDSQRDCFQDSAAGCGNGIVEGDEQCDCGDECDSDPCCTKDCTVPAPKQCSPQDPIKFPCCNSTCMLVPASQGKTCLRRSECMSAVVCDGQTALCPTPAPLPDTTTCACLDGDCQQFPDTAAKVCEAGVCSGSICSAYNATVCYLGGKGDCTVACMGVGWGNGTECVSTASATQRPAALSAPIYYPAGSPCNDFAGYCSNAQECVFVDSDNLLNKLKDFFDSINAQQILEWLKGHLPYVLGGLAAFIILIVVLVRNRNMRGKAVLRGSAKARKAKARQAKKDTIISQRNSAFAYGYDSYSDSDSESDSDGETTQLIPSKSDKRVIGLEKFKCYIVGYDLNDAKKLLKRKPFFKEGMFVLIKESSHFSVVVARPSIKDITDHVVQNKQYKTLRSFMSEFNGRAGAQVLKTPVCYGRPPSSSADRVVSV